MEKIAYVHASNKVVDRLLPADVAVMCESHQCKAEVAPKFDAINEAAKNFILAIQSHCPACADAQTAVRSVREARMWATSAISLNPANWETNQ